MSNYTTAALVLTALLSANCASSRAFTRGTYEDPNTIQMLSDKFNENDLQLIAKKMVASLVESPAVTRAPKPPIVLIGKFKNSTSEHIDLKSLADKIQVQLAKSGRVALLAKEVRQDVAEEYEYQNSGYVNPNAAKGPGQQAAADYVMTGEISSIIQEVGADKLVYYKMTTKLTNVKTALLEWSDEKELRKRFEKQEVSW